MAGSACRLSPEWRGGLTGSASRLCSRSRAARSWDCTKPYKQFYNCVNPILIDGCSNPQRPATHLKENVMVGPRAVVSDAVPSVVLEEPRGKCVLVVDDDAPLVDMLQDVLNDAGYET